MVSEWSIYDGVEWKKFSLMKLVKINLHGTQSKSGGKISEFFYFGKNFQEKGKSKEIPFEHDTFLKLHFLM